MVLRIKAAEILGQLEDELADQVGRAFGLRSFQCFRHGQQLQCHRALLFGSDHRRSRGEFFVAGFAQNGFDAHRRILQVRAGFALEFREPLQIKDVTGNAIVRQISKLDGGNPHRPGNA